MYKRQRYDGSLYFANVSYFEDAVLEALAERPNVKYVLIVGDGINQMDASGEEVVHHLVERLHDAGVTLVFSGLKKQVLDVMRQTGLMEAVSQENIFATEDQAIAAIYARLGDWFPQLAIVLLAGLLVMAFVSRHRAR